MKQKGFTLLEILLVIAAIGILAAIVIVAINPNRQITQVNIARTESQARSIQQAVEQYNIDNSGYPSEIGEFFKKICAPGVDQSTCDSKGLVKLDDDLSPLYLGDLPSTGTTEDPDDSGYEIAVNPMNDRIAIVVPDYNVGINDFPSIILDTEDVDGDGSVDVVQIAGNGSSALPYEIDSLIKLQSLALYHEIFLTSHVQLTQNIDASGVSSWHGGLGFEPIADFNGIFDGGDFTISNLTSNRPTQTSGVGIFSILSENSLVRDLNLDTFSIVCQSNCGTLVGSLRGRVERITVDGSSVGPSGGNQNNTKGGISASVSPTGRIFQSRVLNSNISATFFTGGLTSTILGEIEESYIENVTVSASRIGGMLVANLNGGTILNSYARGTKNGSNPQWGGLGGLAARIAGDGTTSTINSVYANVVHNTPDHPNKGGLVGDNIATPAGLPVINSFWDVDVAAGWTTSQGGTPKTTVEMTDINTFTNTATIGLDDAWDFTDVWAIDGSGIINDGYPYLQWSQN